MSIEIGKAGSLYLLQGKKNELVAFYLETLDIDQTKLPKK